MSKAEPSAKAPASESSARSSGPAPGKSSVSQALGQAGKGASHSSGASFHTDSTASAAASDLGASAFTAGSDVYFGAGQYQPGTSTGNHLIQHEVAHVQQMKSAAPPTPDNYRVSSPGDAAEVSARNHEVGGSGADHTIYRSMLGDIGDAVTGAANTLIDGAMELTGANTLEDFLNALAANDPADALAKWALMPQFYKSTIRLSSAVLDVVGHRPAGVKADTVQSMLEVMNKDALTPMSEAGVSVGERPAYVDYVLDNQNGAYWMQPMKDATQWANFMAAPPVSTAVTEPQAQKLGTFVSAATDVATAKQVFQKVYPALNDTTYNAGFLVAVAWGVDDIKRLYSALAGYLPVNHVHTIVNGFHLGTQHDLDGDGVFQNLGFGWHHLDRIVMPKNSSVAGGGGTGHDMTGGTGSGEATAGTAADPNLSHWDGTVLHEVGHGVGAKTDGNTFAVSHGAWVSGLAVDAWSANMFDDAAADKTVTDKKLKGPVLGAKDARLYMAKKIGGTAHAVAKWKVADIETFIDTHYTGQPLYTYYDWKAKQGNDDYHATADNVAGGSVYVWLSRFGNSYCSYKKDVLDNKVSWYGISSPVEWFAEVYTHFYRTGKSGAGLDADTKTKLEGIDQMKWDPASASGAGALTSGGGGDGPGVGSAPTGDQAGTDNSQPLVTVRRMSLPW